MHRLSTLILGLIFFGASSIEPSLAGKLRCLLRQGRHHSRQACADAGLSETGSLGGGVGSDLPSGRCPGRRRDPGSF